MPKIQDDNINIYGATIVAVSSLKVYIYKGKYIWDVTAKEFEAAPDVTVGASNELTSVAIPNSTNKIGFEITIPADLPIGYFDLVYLDGLVYAGGLRIHKKGQGEIIDVTNKDGVKA